MMDEELLEEFLIECADSRETLDETLLTLEQDAQDAEAVAAAFRAVHSLKGAASFMEAAALEAVSHAAEHLLSAIRDGELEGRPAHFSLLFEASDVLGKLIAELQSKQEPSPVSAFTKLVDALSAASHGEDVAEAETAEVIETSTSAVSEPEPIAETVEEDADEDDVAEPVAQVEASATPVERVSFGDAAKASAAAPNVPESAVRVDVGLLDDLMNLVGELVVCRNRIIRLPIPPDDDELGSSIHRLNELTTALQEKVMKTRMRPVGSAWRRLPRLVRDLATSCNKECVLSMTGEEVELDRSILGVIKDPLAHMIRNAIDHGLESPDDRAFALKPACGHIHLAAKHVGGQVHIELSDDGGGLNTDAIRRRAVSRGLVDEAHVDSLTDNEVHALIFEPGFSTNDSVSLLSGRGVGMDVVRSNLHDVGGSVELHSEQGKGTLVRLKIPLTLAILPALFVHASNHYFAIPQAHLVELIDLKCGRPVTIESLGGAPVLRRRGELLPLVYLHEMLGLPGERDDCEFVVVVRANDLTYGLCIDGVEETEEIVVKPLGASLDSVRAFSGATVRGDGSVALIVDVHTVADCHVADAIEPADDVPDVMDGSTLLRFSLDPTRMGAVEVDSVVRIEDVRASDLLRNGDTCFLERGGQLVPVVDLVGVGCLGDGPLSLLLCKTSERLVAVAVAEVIDVVDTPVELTDTVAAEWSVGVALVHGQATSILDVERLRVA